MKFARVMCDAATSNNVRTEYTGRYTDSWKELYGQNSDIPYDRIRGHELPANHLHDDNILPSPGIPWFRYPELDAPGPGPGPSPPPSPSPPPPPSPSPSPPPVLTAAPTLPSIITDESLDSLVEFLSSVEPQIDFSALVTKSLAPLYDVQQYAQAVTSPNLLPRFRAIFVVSDLYKIRYEMEVYSEEAVMNTALYMRLKKHAPNCIRKNNDAKKNKRDLVNVLVNSWVSLLALLRH